MSGALLVTNENVVNLRIAAERVVCRKDSAPGIPKDVLHPFADQALPQDLRTGSHFAFTSSI